VTGHDLVRLVRETALPVATIVEWLAPDEVDMTGEPESFVTVPAGRRLPVLAFRGDACRFLDPGSRCSVYAARPAACRTFPLEEETIEGPPGRRRLTLLEGAACEGAFDGPPDADGAHDRLERRQRELEAHVGTVTEWNRRQRRRRLAGRKPEPAGAFLELAIESTGSASTFDTLTADPRGQ
jgi:Fe-S-cluster containining protein